MDMRRASIYLLVTMLSVNAWCTMLSSAGIEPPIPDHAFNETAMQENLDANESLSGYSWSIPYSDFVTGALKFMGVVWGLVVGFPNLLTTAGVPGFITTPLYIVWLFIFFGTVLMYWIGGREV